MPTAPARPAPTTGAPTRRGARELGSSAAVLQGSAHGNPRDATPAPHPRSQLALPSSLLPPPACSRECQSEGRCSRCLAGSVLNEATGQCEACGPGCDECDKPGMCTFCANHAVIINGSCVPCPDNCATCSSPNTCTECQDGFAAVSGACVPCADPACHVCQGGPDNCTLCWPGGADKLTGGCRNCTVEVRGWCLVAVELELATARHTEGHSRTH